MGGGLDKPFPIRGAYLYAEFDPASTDLEPAGKKIRIDKEVTPSGV